MDAYSALSVLALLFPSLLSILPFFKCLFVDLEKAFDRVPRKVVEWAMRKSVVPEVMVRAVMSLYEGVKTRVRVGQELSEEFEVKVGVHQGSVFSPLIFAIVVAVVTKSEKWFNE